MVLFKGSLSCAKSQVDTDLKYLVGWYLSSSSQCGDSFLGSEDSSPLWHHSVKCQGLCVFTVMPSALSCVGWNITVFAKHKVDWEQLWTDRQVVLFRRHRSQVSPVEMSPVETPWFPTALPSYVGPLEVYPVSGFFLTLVTLQNHIFFLIISSPVPFYSLNKLKFPEFSQQF